MNTPRVCRRTMAITRVILLGLLVSTACTYGQQLHTGDDLQTSTKASRWTQEHGGIAAQADAFFENYRFHDGEILPRVRIHYATLGNPHRNPQGQIDNAVLVIHWTDADGNTLLSKNFMEALFAPGRPLDATRYFLILADNVGHGKSSKPSDGLKAGFPKYGYADMVDLQHRLVIEKLGIEHLHAILGMSMGGMNAWQWAEAYPDAMDGIMPVVSMPIPISGRNMLWRRIVINAIRSDPQWNGGNYTSPPQGWLNAFPLMGMMLDSVPHLQALVPDGPAADRFIADARSQAISIDANDILYSLSSSADYNPQPRLAAIKTKVYALNFVDDEFNPAELRVLEELMPSVRDGRFIIQPASAESFGHLTMAHPELWSEHVAEFMRSLGDEALR
jgi:homoserine O-acetyltransferase/O-succinyltransferase